MMATQNTSYDTENNYEGLETLGDSVLKFVVTQHLILNLNNRDENTLTNIRHSYISNKYLAIWGYLNDIHER